MTTMVDDFSHRWLDVNHKVLAFLLATTRDRVVAEDLRRQVDDLTAALDAAAADTDALRAEK